MNIRPRAPAAPPRGSRRLPWRQGPLVALDFETTGLDAARDAVVSLGLVPVRGGRIEMAGARYQRVRSAVPPSPISITIHHLRPLDLAGAPGIEDARAVLRSGLGGRFLLTWAAEVEAVFLSGLFGGAPRRWLRRSIDVQRLVLRADRLAGRRGDLTLGGAAARHGVPVEDTHHALDDAFMTAELFLVVAPRLEAHGYRTLADLLTETRVRVAPRDRTA